MSHQNTLEMKWFLSPLKIHILKLTLIPNPKPGLMNQISFHQNSLIMIGLLSPLKLHIIKNHFETKFQAKFATYDQSLEKNNRD